MKFLHQPFFAHPEDRIVVEFDKPTVVLLIHSSQFEKYKGGRTYKYRGGFYDKSPVEFKIPYKGVWHAVIEKGTYNNPIEVKAKAKVIKKGHHTLNGAVQLETPRKIEKHDDAFEYE